MAKPALMTPGTDISHRRALGLLSLRLCVEQCDGQKRAQGRLGHPLSAPSDRLTVWASLARSACLANPKCCALRASTICRIAKLTLNLFAQSFPLPGRAVTFDNVTGAKKGMGFRSVITDTDSYIFVEWANRCRTGGFQRISNSRSEIISAAIGGHKSLLQLS
jgi:hypothetical protein